MEWWQIVLVCWVICVVGLTFLGWMIARNRDREDAVKDACDHAYGPWRWTQDGWVHVCKFFGKWTYGGDDWNGGPK